MGYEVYGFLNFTENITCALNIFSAQKICQCVVVFSILYDSEKGCKDQESIQKVPHWTQDIDGKVTNSQLDIINESQEVSPFPAGDHKVPINRRARKHNKHKTEIT